MATGPYGAYIGEKHTTPFQAMAAAERAKIAQEANTPEMLEKTFQQYLKALDLPADVSADIVAQLRQIDIKEANEILRSSLQEQRDAVFEATTAPANRMLSAAGDTFAKFNAYAQSNPVELRKALLNNKVIREAVGGNLQGLDASPAPWAIAAALVGAYFLLKK